VEVSSANGVSMETSHRISIPVTEHSQVGEARRRATRMAQSCPFDETEIGRISIVASELATNLVKHATAGGNIIVQLAEQGLELIAVNKAPGFNNSDAWLADGYSTASTLGTGLGAVKRLSTSFDLFSEASTGTAVLARLHPRSSPVSNNRFDVGIVNLPKEGESVCGDNCTVAQEGAIASVILCDGLGHGFEAAEAANAAIRIFNESPLDDPMIIVQRIHVGLKGSRGAAVSIVHIDQSTGRALFCGIGNVSGCIEGEEQRRHLVPHNGTAGYEARKLHLMETEWTRNSVLVLHSDGLSSSWNVRGYEGLLKHRASVIAAVLHRDYGKSRDDSTVLVMKNTPGT
jgi:anti-sigma regulatory factor (Ser/Thr protein kinase)